MNKTLNGNKPALTIAALALFIALGGPASAADVTSAAAKLITGKKVKDNSITSADIRNGSLTAKDFKRGVLPAKSAGTPATPVPTGSQGAQGPQGEPGAKGEPGPSTPATPTAVENWHVIGQPGEPGWLNLSGANAQWGAVGPYTNSAAFYKDPSGVVHLRGFLRCTSATNQCSNLQSFFALPAGYRPERREIHATVGSESGYSTDPLTIAIDEDGTVYRNSAVGNNWVTLDGITFRAAK